MGLAITVTPRKILDFFWISFSPFDLAPEKRTS